MQLQPGDLICLFTDGITEATDGTEMFGLPRLLAAISRLPMATLPEDAQELRNAVRQFEAGHPPSDDLTLLLLRWNGPNAG